MATMDRYVDVDMRPNGVPPRVKLSQYEYGWNVYVNLYYDNSTWTPDAGTTAYVSGTKKDMTGFQYEVSWAGNKVTVPLTDQMTAFAGDTVIEITFYKGSARIATANFILEVEPTALSDDIIVSETDLSLITHLIEMLQKLEEALEEARKSADEAKASEIAAKASEIAAKASEEAAKTSETNSKASEIAAKASELAAKASETAAAASATNSANSATQSANSATQSANSATASAKSADESEKYAKIAHSWANGGTTTDYGTSTDNSYYWYLQAKKVADDLGYPIDPKGSTTFENLPTTPTIGWLYNVTNDFTTDSRFEEGAGIHYNAGAEVYWTSNGKWSVMAGAGVTGVKGDAETEYRKGQVNLTPANIGALPLQTGNKGQILGFVDDNTVGAVEATETVPIATTAVAGKVKPDGTTISVDADGTIHGAADSIVDDSTIKKNSDKVIRVNEWHGSSDEISAAIASGAITENTTIYTEESGGSGGGADLSGYAKLATESDATYDNSRVKTSEKSVITRRSGDGFNFNLIGKLTDEDGTQDLNNCALYTGSESLTPTFDGHTGIMTAPDFVTTSGVKLSEAGGGNSVVKYTSINTTNGFVSVEGVNVEPGSLTIYGDGKYCLMRFEGSNTHNLNSGSHSVVVIRASKVLQYKNTFFPPMMASKTSYSIMPISLSLNTMKTYYTNIASTQAIVMSGSSDTTIFATTLTESTAASVKYSFFALVFGS